MVCLERSVEEERALLLDGLDIGSVETEDGYSSRKIGSSDEFEQSLSVRNDRSSGEHIVADENTKHEGMPGEEQGVASSLSSWSPLAINNVLGTSEFEYSYSQYSYSREASRE